MPATREQIIIGRRLLKRLLPAALAAAEQPTGEVRTGTAVAAAMQSHLTLERFDALVISEGERGGWHVDLLLRDMPPGVPNVLGTPVESPFPTRQQAQASAPQLLVHLVTLARMEKAAPAAPVFEFHNTGFTIQPALLQHLCAEGFPETDGAMAWVQQRLESLDQALFPDGFSPAAFDQLPLDSQRHLLAVIHLAATLGLFRYPERLAGLPNEQGPAHTVH